MKPVVAIVGRPNVGKSALFNKLIGRRKAITKNEPGVTRDVNYGECMDRGRSFTLIDTGGFEPDLETEIPRQVREQARLAMEEADLIVMVMDVRTGLTSVDTDIVRELQRNTEKSIIYVANKTDTHDMVPQASEFYSLGIGDIMPISAEHGLGIVELIDKILDLLPEEEEEEVELNQVKVAIVGRPNAGKSSLLNRMIGKKRTIVSDVPGTTRDPVDTKFRRGETEYLFVDTAGIRRKSKISAKLEIYSSMAAIKSIARSNVILLVIDGKDGVRMQDEKIAGLIEDSGRACIVVINKWDIVDRDEDTIKVFTEELREKMPFIAFAPVLFVSALTGKRVDSVFDTIDRVVKAMNTDISTSRVNKLLEEVVSRHHPPVYRGHEVRFYYGTQTGKGPTRFAIFTNYPDGVIDSYRRYMVNRFRESLDMEEIPLRLSFRPRR